MAVVLNLEGSLAYSVEIFSKTRRCRDYCSLWAEPNNVLLFFTFFGDSLRIVASRQA